MVVVGPERTQTVGPRLGGTMIKHPKINWEANDKYNELKNFRLEVNNVFKLYSTPHADQIAIIKKLARQRRPTIPRIINTDGTMEGLFTKLNIDNKPQYNETIKSLQFHKFGRQTNQNAEEWMG